MQDEASSRTVVVAVLVNLAVTAAKAVAAVLTGSSALAALLPAFVRYDGRDGLAHKQAADAEWAAAAHERLGDPSPIR